MNRVSLVEQPQDLEQRLAQIRSRMQSLAAAALQQDKQALKQIESLEAEQLAINRQATLEELAALEAAKQQAEAEAEAKRKVRADLEQQALQEAQIILDADRSLDDLANKMRIACERRATAVAALARTHVLDPVHTFRLTSRFGLTRALHAAGLAAFASIEAVQPAHKQPLAEIDKFLSHPLTVSAEPLPAETGSKSNGADR